MPPQDDERYRGNAFAEKHGLVWSDHSHNGGIGDAYYTIKPLARSADEYSRVLDLFNADEPYSWLSHAIFDHGVHYKKQGQRGPSRIVAIVTSPYLRTLIREFGSPAAANDAIHRIAQEMGLAVRVGIEADRVYFVEGETIPILWWRREAVQFPLPGDNEA